MTKRSTRTVPGPTRGDRPRGGQDARKALIEQVSENCYQAAKAGIWCIDYVVGGSPERSIAYDEYVVARARRAWHHGRLALEALSESSVSSQPQVARLDRPYELWQCRRGHLWKSAKSDPCPVCMLEREVAELKSAQPSPSQPAETPDRPLPTIEEMVGCIDFGATTAELLGVPAETPEERKDAPVGTVIGSDGRAFCRDCGRTDIWAGCDERSCPIRRAKPDSGDVHPLTTREEALPQGIFDKSAGAEMADPPKFPTLKGTREEEGRVDEA
jgi:hypothetical protein